MNTHRKIQTIALFKGAEIDYITFCILCQGKCKKGGSLMKKQLKVIELFAGIGAPRKALIRGGYNYEIVDAIEIDKYAVKSYNAIYDDNIEPKDVCEYKPNKTDVGEIDLLFHGSPCTSFSSAGKQEGGDKGSGTPSSLMYETIRIVELLKPKYIIWENVKNLLSKKHRHNFDAYLDAMEKLGYNNYYQVLNAKDYGVPQNRERIFTISIRKNVDAHFNFPEKQELKIMLKDILEDADNKYGMFLAIKKGAVVDDKIKPSVRVNFEREKDSIINSDQDIYGCQCNSGWCDNRVGLRVSPTLRAGNDNTFCLTNDLLIRKLTPKECWRLMGFDDIDFEKASKVNSNTQLYKQAGNSIVVNVLEAIFDNLLQEYK